MKFISIFLKNIHSVLFLILLFTSGMIFSQDNYINDQISLNKNNKGIKKITTRVNDTIFEFQYFNKNGMLYFSKSLREFFHIAYYKYDDKNRIIKKVNGHAALGFSCDEIKYSNKKTALFSYLTEDEKESQIEHDKYLDNKAKGIEYTIVGSDTIAIDDAYAVTQSYQDYYKFGTEIKGINDTIALLNSPNFKKLLNEPKYLDFFVEYDTKSRPIVRKFFNSRNKLTSLNNFNYSNQKIIMKYTTDMIGTGQVIKTLDQFGNVVNEVDGDKTLTYTYENQLCTEMKEFKNNKLLYATSYKYENKLLKRSIYEDLQSCSGKYISDYTYNDKKLITQTINSSRNNKNIYTYEYEYY
jgi:hypothetical protein